MDRKHIDNCATHFQLAKWCTTGIIKNRAGQFKCLVYSGCPNSKTEVTSDRFVGFIPNTTSSD